MDPNDLASGKIDPASTEPRHQHLARGFFSPVSVNMRPDRRNAGNHLRFARASCVRNARVLFG
ncbi:peptidoglycan glycosyltransferase [Anopheles sinensis]|uniref:Peptidoglycan glycosyltransferase n=1 Tax=Anopheles sinensis TaxID=74873 RepID=A0A084WAF0_ANOSI|nr:peptidoglycan glycosyltransferase [Anopheles sinensis]